MRMKKVVYLSVVSCLTACATKAPQAPMPTVAANIIVPNFGGPQARQPASKNYISEIENARGYSLKSRLLGHLVADQNGLNRMMKMFEFARQEPHEFFSYMRRTRPVYQLQKVEGAKKVPDVFLVTRYADVKTVVSTPNVYGVPYGKIMNPTLDAGYRAEYDAKGEDFVNPKQRQYGNHVYMLAGENGPANAEKAQMWGIVDGRSNVAQVKETVAHLAQRAIQQGAWDGKIDVVAKVTRAVPIGVNDEYFGFNAPADSLARWSRATQHAFFHNSPPDKQVKQRSLEAGAEMRDYISQVLLPERETELRNGRTALDPVSKVIFAKDALARIHEAAGVPPGAVTHERIVANIIGLLVGSVETTSAAIAQSLQQLFILQKQNPQAFAQVLAAAQNGDDKTFYKAVWEALRFDTVNPWVARVVKSDTEIGGVKLAKGAVVLASIESGMLDETVFTDPTSFRLDRPDELYFHLGGPDHRCLGDAVAYTMVPETIKQILMLKNVRPVANVDQQGGPFPEKYVLAFESSPFKDTDNSDSPQVGDAIYTRFLLLADKLKRTFKNPTLRREGLDALTTAYGAEERKLSHEASAARCEQSKELFSQPSTRKAFCALPGDFRGCYLVHKVMGQKSAVTAWNHCAYGERLLEASARDSFKKQVRSVNEFYFLKYEDQ